jgi:hypothetical protein
MLPTRNLALNRQARQSSLYDGSPNNGPAGGVDGIKNRGFGFSTNQEQSPWWMVDLGANYALSEARIFNRLDCCSERARTLQILLSQDGQNWQTVYRHDGTVFGGVDGRQLSVALQGRTARYVRLQLAEDNLLHLDEVEVYGQEPASGLTQTPASGLPLGNAIPPVGGSQIPAGAGFPPAQIGSVPQVGTGTNLALNRPTRQSSLYNGAPGYGSSNGVDGKMGAFFHTDQEAAPWWQVDLGAAHVLSEVRIYNRLNCCSERARTIQVLLSQDAGNWQTVYSHNGSVFGGADGRPLVVPLNGRTARYVRLQLAESNYLHLEEVEVYGQRAGGAAASASSIPTTAGTPAGPASANTTSGAGTMLPTRNLALNQPTRESSVYNGLPGDSSIGVDGKTGSIFHTNQEAAPWWQVDLGAAHVLSEVRIYNRLDCCSERARTIQVLLSQDGGSWQKIYVHNGSVFGGSDGRPLVVPLNGRTARYVRLQLAENNYLHLEEVEVYGQ